MAVEIVDSPRTRRAGSLDLFNEDVLALRAFRCFAGAGAWYERDAYKVLKRAITKFESRALGSRDRVLLFEWDDLLLAVGVFSEESATTAHLAFVGLRRDVHGARIDSADGDRLSDAVLGTTLEVAAELGFRRVTAQVASDHERSKALLRRAGFQRVSRFDRDYEIWAVSVS